VAVGALPSIGSAFKLGKKTLESGYVALQRSREQRGVAETLCQAFH
jgi:hypothetical protein